MGFCDDPRDHSVAGYGIQFVGVLKVILGKRTFLRLLAMLTAKPVPMSVADVEVRKTWV
jgi:hypothetical protein